MQKKLGGGTDFPFMLLEALIYGKEKIDNFIILSDMMIAPGKNEMQARGFTVSSILKKYREEVNPDLLFVAIDLYGSGKSLVDVNESGNPKDVMITGFSDNILRFISERGNAKQLDYIQHIDEIKGVNKPREKRNKKQKVDANTDAKLEVKKWS